MRARESNTLDSINRGDPIKQLYERYSWSKVEAVRVHRLPKKHDLATAPMDGNSDLTLNLTDIARDLGTTGSWHDAVGTTLVTPSADRYEGGHMVRLAMLSWIYVREPQGQLLPILAIVHSNLRGSSFFSELDQRRHKRQIVRAEHEINVAAPLQDSLPLLLSNASTHAHHHAWL